MRGPVRKRYVAAAAVLALFAIAGAAQLVMPWLREGLADTRAEIAAARLAGHTLPIARAVAHTVALRALGPVIEGLDPMTVGIADAQTRLNFTPVSEESARAFERRTAERHAARNPVTAPLPPAAVVPAPPRTSASAPPAPIEPIEPLPPTSTGNIVQIGSDIHIERGQVVDGDVLSINSDIRVDGHVRGNVSATRGDVTLGATARVDGDVLCLGGTLHEEPGASVGGQRVTGLEGRERSSRLRERLREARGDMRGIDDGDRDSDQHERGARGVVRSLIYMLMWVLVAWVIAHFAPVRTRTALASIQQEGGMSFGLGFLMVLLIVPSLVALALVVAVLCITIIGIPVALGVLFAYIGLCILLAGWGAVVGYAALGQRIASGSGRTLPSVATAAVWGAIALHGVLVMGRLLKLAPLLGGFGTLLHVLGIVAYAVLVLLGMGALVRSKFGQGPHGRWWPPQYLFGNLPVSPMPPAPAGSAAYWPSTPAMPPAPAAPAAPMPPTSYAPPPPPTAADTPEVSASTPPSGTMPMPIVPPPPPQPPSPPSPPSPPTLPPPATPGS